MSEWTPIPGETPIDVSGLLDSSITNRTQLAVAEAENIRKVVVKYYTKRPNQRSAPFDFSWLLKLHREMFCDVWSWAGVIRTRNLNLGIEFYQVAPSLLGMVEDLLVWQESVMPLIAQSARLHYEAVRIHPFENGNGRWARLLSNIWLLRQGALPIEWPDDAMGQVSPIRNLYLAAIQSADAGNLALLTELHDQYQRKA